MQSSKVNKIDVHGLKIQGEGPVGFITFLEGGSYWLGFLRREGSFRFEFIFIFIN